MNRDDKCCRNCTPFADDVDTFLEFWGDITVELALAEDNDPIGDGGGVQSRQKTATLWVFIHIRFMIFSTF